MTARRDPDTRHGGEGGRFPLTRHSAVIAARSADVETRRRAFELLGDAYWKPVYKYVRVRWRASNEDAKELTQGFLARAFEKDYFAAYDPSRARFRTFLRTCLERYVATERESDARLKRGGGATHVPLGVERDGTSASLEVASEDDLERYFHREWVRTLFERAIESFRASAAADGKAVQCALFERYDLAGEGERPTYAALAREHSIPESQVTNHLAWARREFRRILLANLRAISASDDEFRAEARALFGAEDA